MELGARALVTISINQSEKSRLKKGSSKATLLLLSSSNELNQDLLYLSTFEHHGLRR